MARVKAFLTVLVGLISLHTSLALPTRLNTTTLRERFVPADDISIYSFDVRSTFPIKISLTHDFSFSNV